MGGGDLLLGMTARPVLAKLGMTIALSLGREGGRTLWAMLKKKTGSEI